ncbi:Phage tail protein [Pararobbsia alpina]|uniref:hypothetical protein n=1 Tax=Pararobbsia alpina TaxID=621374 RepID=UPI0039A70648
MQANQTPTLVPLSWAANGTKNVIPEASQITITKGAASLNDGFPPICAIPTAAGGSAPAYGDFNGILNLLSQTIRWAHGGGMFGFSSSFAADTNVTGYPQGAELLSADLSGTWMSLVDSNTDNPDTGPGTKWVPARAYGITTVGGLTNANVTLTPTQAAKNRITLAGALTANVQIIMPTWTRDWTIVNNTTGAFTVTVKTSAGSGIAIPQNGSPTRVTGDGTNIVQAAENIANGTQPSNPATLAQNTGIVGSTRNLICNLAAAGTTLTFTADEIGIKGALGGQAQIWANVSSNNTVTTSTTNAIGGVVGAALVASGFAVIYAAYNISTGAFGFYAKNGNTKQPTIDTSLTGWVGTLISVWNLNASTQFVAGDQLDRCVSIATVVLFSTTALNGTPTAISVASVLAPNVTEIDGALSLLSTGASQVLGNAISSSTAGVGAQGYQVNATATAQTWTAPFSRLKLATAQNVFLTSTSAPSGGNFSANCGRYYF